MRCSAVRVLTVHEATNPRYWRLIQAFEQRTGRPVLVDSNFNVRGEPIVCSPGDAFRCFMGSDIEVLPVGNGRLRKEAQDPRLTRGYEDAFELD